MKEIKNLAWLTYVWLGNAFSEDKRVQLSDTKEHCLIATYLKTPLPGFLPPIISIITNLSSASDSESSKQPNNPSQLSFLLELFSENPLVFLEKRLILHLHVKLLAELREGARTSTVNHTQ